MSDFNVKATTTQQIDATTSTESKAHSPEQLDGMTASEAANSIEKLLADGLESIESRIELIAFIQALISEAGAALREADQQADQQAMLADLTKMKDVMERNDPRGGVQSLKGQDMQTWLDFREKYVLTGKVQDPFSSGASSTQGIGTDGIFVRAEYNAFMESLNGAIGKTQAALNTGNIKAAPDAYFSTLGDLATMDRALEGFQNSPQWVQNRGFDVYLTNFCRREGLSQDFQQQFMDTCTAAGISFEFGKTLDRTEVAALRNVIGSARDTIQQNMPTEVRMEMLRDMERMQDIMENNKPHQGFWLFGGGHGRLTGEDKQFWNEFRDKYVTTGIIEDPGNRGGRDWRGIGSDAAFSMREYQGFMDNLNQAIGHVKSAGPMNELLAGKVDAFNYFPAMEDMSKMNRLLDSYENRPWYERNMSVEQFAQAHAGRMGLEDNFVASFMMQYADSGILPADFATQMAEGDVDGMRASVEFTANLMAESPPDSLRLQMTRDMERMREIMNNNEPSRWGVDRLSGEDMEFWQDFRARYVDTGIVQDPFNTPHNDRRGIGSDGVYNRQEWQGFMDSLNTALTDVRGATPSSMGLMEYQQQVSDLTDMQSLIDAYQNSGFARHFMSLEQFAAIEGPGMGIDPGVVERFKQDFVDSGRLEVRMDDHTGLRETQGLADAIGRELGQMRSAPPAALHQGMLTDMQEMMRILERHQPGETGTTNMVDQFTPDEMAFWQEFRTNYVDTGIVPDPFNLPFAPKSGIGADGVFMPHEWQAFGASLQVAMTAVEGLVAAETAHRVAPPAEEYAQTLGDMGKMDELVARFEDRPWWQQGQSFEQFAQLEAPRMGLDPNFVQDFKDKYVDTGMVAYDFGTSLDRFEAAGFREAIGAAMQDLRADPPPAIQAQMLADMERMAAILDAHEPSQYSGWWGGGSTVERFSGEDMAFWLEFKANYVDTGMVADPMSRSANDTMGIGSDGVFVKAEWDAFRESLHGTMEQMRETSPLVTVQADRYLETMTEMHQMGRILDQFQSEPWFVQSMGVENYIQANHEQLGVSAHFFGDFKRDHVDSGRVDANFGSRLDSWEIGEFRAALSSAARNERMHPPTALHSDVLADMGRMADIMLAHQPGEFGSANMVEQFTPEEMEFWQAFRSTYVETGVVPDPFDRGGSDIMGIGSDGVFVKTEWDAFMTSLTGAMTDLAGTRPTPFQEMKAELEQIAQLYPETAPAATAVASGDMEKLEALLEMLNKLLEMLMPEAEAEAAKLQAMTESLHKATELMETAAG